jgi:hypothetical protein
MRQRAYPYRGLETYWEAHTVHNGQAPWEYPFTTREEECQVSVRRLLFLLSAEGENQCNQTETFDEANGACLLLPAFRDIC